VTKKLEKLGSVPNFRQLSIILLAACLWLAPLGPGAWATELRIGSKTFTESYILGEIAAQLLQSEGFSVEHEQGLGGTLVAFEALKSGAIDLYPEYTGTLTQAVLGSPGLERERLAAALREKSLSMQVFLGFDNSYAIGVGGSLARQYNLKRISDLADRPDLRAAFSHEFLNRGDGWPALRAAYQLPQQPVGIEHALAYGAIEAGQLDFTDAYTTDGELAIRDIVLLADDRGSRAR
jgi:osmoprotectant transport system permease protein